MFKVNVTVQNATLKKYVSDYITRLCRTEIDKQLEYVTSLTIAQFLEAKLDDHVANNPDLQEQIKSMVKAHLSKHQHSKPKKPVNTQKRIAQ